MICKYCNLIHDDNQLTCVVCGKSLVPYDDKKMDIVKVGYPKLVHVRKKRYFALKLFGLISIATSLIVGFINFLTYKEHPEMWSLIVIGALLYIWLFISTILLSKHDYSTKVIKQVVTISIILVLIDVFTTYSGWALTFVIPFILTLTTIALPIVVASMPKKYFMHVRKLFILILIDLLYTLIPFITDWMIKTYDWTALMAGISGLILLSAMFIFARKTTIEELVKIFHV